MLHTWKPQLKRCYSLIEPSATSTSTRLFNWIFLSCQRDRHPFYACCVWLLVFCTFARFHGICLGNKVARARIKVMNGFPRGPTTTSILVTSSSIQKWIWPGLVVFPLVYWIFFSIMTAHLFWAPPLGHVARRKPCRNQVDCYFVLKREHDYLVLIFIGANQKFQT